MWAEGRLPESLDKLRLPPGLANAIARSVVTYRPSGTAYTVEWKHHAGRAVFDGATRTIKVFGEGAKETSIEHP